MAFHLGSLGFLTSFKFEHFREDVAHVLEGEASDDYNCVCDYDPDYD